MAKIQREAGIIYNKIFSFPLKKLTCLLLIQKYANLTIVIEIFNNF